jgi:hypothetical protein
MHVDDNQWSQSFTWYPVKLHLIEVRNYGRNYNVWDKVLMQKEIPWTESASELYRPSDHRLSAKLVPTFADIAVSRCRGGFPTAVISVF